MASGEIWFRWGAALVVGGLIGIIGSTVNPWSVVGRLDALEERMTKMEIGETTPISKVTLQRFVDVERRIGVVEAQVDTLQAIVNRLEAQRVRAQGKREPLPPWKPLPPWISRDQIGG